MLISSYTNYIHDELRIQNSILNSYKKILSDLKDYSDCYLSMNIVKGNNYYYLHHKGQTKRLYLGNIQHPDVQRIQQYKYAEELVRRAEQNIKAMELFISTYQPLDDMAIREALASPYRNVLNIPAPVFSMDALQWKQDLEELKLQYPPSYRLDPTKAHRAGNGTLCRSKSECVLLDMYTVLGIPCVYEGPYFFKSRIIHPDFTLLRIKDMKTLYHEHLGLFFSEDHKEEYRASTLWKLDQYADRNIIPGSDLILTFEAPGGLIDGEAINRTITSFFDI